LTKKSIYVIIGSKRVGSENVYMVKRHAVIWKILHFPVQIFLHLRFGYTWERADQVPTNYLVVSNHVTDYDPLFVAASFPDPMYFVASEHISRWKTAYALLRFFFDPILCEKGAVSFGTVRCMLKRLKEGSSVTMFPEGIRSWDGCTGEIHPGVGRIVKTAGCSLVTYKITGGYFVSPGWSEKSIRRGRIHGAPVRVYTPEMLSEMTTEEIEQCVVEDLSEDAHATQALAPTPYKSRKKAEKLENLLYICPYCYAYDSMVSAGNDIRCGQCQRILTIDAYGNLEGAPYANVKELSLWLHEAALSDVRQQKSYEDSNAVLSVLKNHKSVVLAQGRLTMDTCCLQCGDTQIPMSSIQDMDICGRHAIVFTSGGRYFELCPKASAYKYLLYYKAYKNSLKK